MEGSREFLVKVPGRACVSIWHTQRTYYKNGERAKVDHACSLKKEGNKNIKLATIEPCPSQGHELNALK